MNYALSPRGDGPRADNLLDRPRMAFLVLIPLFLVSGATGLVYELVWTRELVFVFGGTTHAISTVLTAFMGGLGLGSYLIGRYTRYMRQPGMVYGALEIVIGLYALIVPFLLGLAEPLYRALYPHVQDQMGALTAVRFVVGLAILAFPTTLMGATLPVLVRYIMLRGGRLGQSVGLLYGINSGGAVLGTLATGFFLIPLLGLSATTHAAAAANVAVGLASLWLLRLPPGLELSESRQKGRKSNRERLEDEPLSPGLRKGVLIAFALSGFAAMVYQVMWTRILVTSIGSSTYAFTCILAAFIFGLALGSIVIARFADTWRNPATPIAVIIMLIGLLAMWIAPAYGEVPTWAWRMVREHGDDYGALIRAQFMLIMGVTLGPTLLMGALFPLVTRAVTRGAEDAGAATGRAYGVNTIGTLLGSFTAGFILIRSDFGDALGVPLGMRNSLLYASALNVLSGAALLSAALWRGAGAGNTARMTGRRWMTFGLLAGGGLLMMIPPYRLTAWNVLVMNSGAFYGYEQRAPDWMTKDFDVAYYGEGVDLNVLVARGRITGDLTLFVNGTPNASTSLEDFTTNELLGHVPMLLADEPKDVCLIGLGCGVTLGSIVQHPEAESVDSIEISEEVIRAAAVFNEYSYHVCDPERADERIRMIRNDGRNHLLLTDRLYDVIISEPSHPWMAGVANLFTREFFELCRDRLKPGGVTAVWLHGYKISKDSFRLVVRTLFDVFPNVSIWRLGPDDFLMVATMRPEPLPLNVWLDRFRQPTVRADLYRVGLGQPERILEMHLASGEPLRRWAGEGEIHTDDNARLEFRTPMEFREDNGEALRREFEKLNRRVFEDTLAYDENDPRQTALRERMRTVIEAERIFSEAQRMDAVSALKRLREAYRLDPGNPLMFRYEMILQQAIGQNPPPMAAEPLREHQREWRRLRPPAMVSRTGDTLEAIAERLVEQARQELQHNFRQSALHMLEEAVDIAPENSKAWISLAETILAMGDTERAAALIGDALNRGVLSPEALPESLRGLPADNDRQP